MEVDALATPSVLEAGAARSTNMREALRVAKLLPQYARFLPRLFCSHAYGENNTAADAASRQKWAVLEGIARQLGHRLQRVEISGEAICFLNDVLRACSMGAHREPHWQPDEGQPPGVVARPSGPQLARAHARRADPAAPGGTAIRFMLNGENAQLEGPLEAQLIASDEAISAHTLDLLPPPAVFSQTADSVGALSESALLPGELLPLATATPLPVPHQPSPPRHLPSPSVLGNSVGQRKRKAVASPLPARDTGRLARSPSGAPTPWLPAIAGSLEPEAVAELLDAVVVPPPAERPGALGLPASDLTTLMHEMECTRAERATTRALEHALAKQRRGKAPLHLAKSAEVAHEMYESLCSDSSRHALRPADSSTLELACDRLVTILQGHVPKTVQSNESSNWRHWVAFCAHMNTSPWRDDVAANRGGPGHDREVHLLALGLLYIYARMKPAKRSPNRPPKPSSALAVLRGVRRMHKRMGYDMVPLTMAVRLAAALADEYVLEHGPEMLQPQRTEPLTTDMVDALVNIPNGTRLSGRAVVDRRSLRDTSLRACFATMARTGFRADEVALRSGGEHTLKRLSRWHLRWRLGGSEPVAELTVEQLNGLKAGDFAILIPPTSKADQFGMEWGCSPIYLRFNPDEKVNAARELRDLELVWRVRGDARRTTPLFVDGSKSAITQSTLRAEFTQRLNVAAEMPGASFSAAEVGRVTLHSFRVYLACALLALKRSHDEIKALLRWKSDEAIRIYARLNADAYADLLDGVGSASIDSYRSHNLPQQLRIAPRVEALTSAAGRTALVAAGERADERAAAEDDAAVYEPADSESED